MNFGLFDYSNISFEYLIKSIFLVYLEWICYCKCLSLPFYSNRVFTLYINVQLFSNGWPPYWISNCYSYRISSEVIQHYTDHILHQNLNHPHMNWIKFWKYDHSINIIGRHLEFRPLWLFEYLWNPFIWIQRIKKPYFRGLACRIWSKIKFLLF